MFQYDVAIGHSLRRWIRNTWLFRVDSPVNCGKPILESTVRFGPKVYSHDTYNQMYVGSCTSGKVHGSNSRGQPRERLQIERELSQFGGVIAGGTLLRSTRARTAEDSERRTRQMGRGMSKRKATRRI